MSNLANDLGMKPLLKWPGGKRWLLPQLERCLPISSGRLIEPFCGGAALFFHAAPRLAVLADLNRELIEFYGVVQQNPRGLIANLSSLANDEETYYKVRGSNPSDEVQRAARFYYLCRLSFNGIYRVNLNGEFNVPYGYKISRPVFESEEISKASNLLKNCELKCQDFEITINKARKGDLVLADPPYTVAHNNNGFIKYNEKIFSFEDQERLAICARAAANRGATVLVTNADHDSIRELYQGDDVATIQRYSIIGSRAEYRKQVTELLIQVTK